ncbi:TPA: hypothetical protein HA244_01925 [Candidatus Micrarchaeota archaeon]|nr:hypothetical protein [Candidatus Micrarchaeota archaeon]
MAEVHTKKIELFSPRILSGMRKARNCVVVDLTKTKMSETGHLPEELGRHRTNLDREGFVFLPGHLAARPFELAKAIAEQVKKEKRAGAATPLVVLFGFHRNLPTLLTALGDRKIKHWVVLSNVQHERLDEEMTPQKLRHLKTELMAFAPAS